MNEKIKKVMGQIGTMILTAIIASILAYLQNILTQQGVSCEIKIDPTETGAIALGLKGVHAYLQSTKLV